jgi:hypothetical protein
MAFDSIDEKSPALPDPPDGRMASGIRMSADGRPGMEEMVEGKPIVLCLLE